MSFIAHFFHYPLYEVLALLFGAYCGLCIYGAATGRRPSFERQVPTAAYGILAVAMSIVLIGSTSATVQSSPAKPLPQMSVRHAESVLQHHQARAFLAGTVTGQGLFAATVPRIAIELSSGRWYQVSGQYGGALQAAAIQSDVRLLKTDTQLPAAVEQSFRYNGSQIMTPTIVGWAVLVLLYGILGGGVMVVGCSTFESLPGVRRRFGQQPLVGGG